MPLPLREIDKKLAEFKQRGIVPKDITFKSSVSWLMKLLEQKTLVQEILV